MPLQHALDFKLANSGEVTVSSQLLKHFMSSNSKVGEFFSIAINGSFSFMSLKYILLLHFLLIFGIILTVSKATW